MTKLIAGLGLSAALAFAAPTTAEAQQGGGPVFTGGLVNVTIVDVADVVIRDINVGVNAALAIAANVCDTTVAILQADLSSGDRTATCTNDIGQTVTLTQTGRRGQ